MKSHCHSCPKASETTSDLLKSVAAAGISGSCAALCAAPFISIVDKVCLARASSWGDPPQAITANASGLEPLWQCMGNGLKKLVKEPIAFVKQPSFKWIAFVYSGTYVAANLTQVLCGRKGVVRSFPGLFGAFLVFTVSSRAAHDFFLKYNL